MSQPHADLSCTEAIPGNVSGIYFILVSNLPNGTSAAELQSLAGNIDGCFVYPGTGDGWVRVHDHETFLSIHNHLNGLEHQGSKIQASKQNENEPVSIWAPGVPQVYQGYGVFGIMPPPAGPTGYDASYAGAAPYGYSYGTAPPPAPGYTGYGSYPGYPGHAAYGVPPPPGATGEGSWFYPLPDGYVPDGGLPPGFHAGYGQDVYYPQLPPPPPQRLDDPNSEEKCKIIVKQLSRHLSKKELIAYLHKAAGGRQKLREDVRMPRWGDRTRLQHAFMVFKTHEDAAKAIENLNEKPFHGLTIEARFSIELGPPERKAEPAAGGPAGGQGRYGEDGGSEAAATYQSPLVVDGTSKSWKEMREREAQEKKAGKKK